LVRVLKIGDHATGTNVLEELYAQWSETPIYVDLPALWAQLGIAASQNTVRFDSNAPLAAVRAAITENPSLRVK